MTLTTMLAFVSTAIMARMGGEPKEPEPKPEVKEPEPEKTAEPEPEPEEEEDTASLQRANRELMREIRELRETNHYLRRQMRDLHALYERQWSQQAAQLMMPVVSLSQEQAARLQAQDLGHARGVWDLGHAHGFCTCVPARADVLRSHRIEHRIVWPDDELKPGTPD